MPSHVPVRRVSPGFVPRPSLSAARCRRPDGIPSRVAGVCAPAFVERRSTPVEPPGCGRVAGVCAPAFVERSGSKRPESRSPGVAGVCAPAFVERAPLQAAQPPPWSVAGVCAPAFVERCRPRPCIACATRVSPGFVPRPSLSADGGGAFAHRDECRRGLCPGLR